MDESTQVAQHQFGIAPGDYVPGLSLEAATAKDLAQRGTPLPSLTSVATAAAPPEAASEAGPTKRRRSLSARTHSKGRNKIIKSESSDEVPPCTDGWLPVIVNSPTSATEEVPTDDNIQQKGGYDTLT